MTGKHRLVIGAELDAFDADTGGIPTFEHRTPMVAHTVPGYSAVRPASPSRRTGYASAAPVPESEPEGKPPVDTDWIQMAEVRERIDWPTLVRRVLIVVAAAVTLFGVWRLARSGSADELMLGAQLVSGGWIALGALIGWGTSRG